MPGNPASSVRSALSHREREVIMRKRAGILIAVAGLLPAMLGLLPPTAATAAPDASVTSFLTGTVVLSPANAWAVGWDSVPGTTFLDSFSLHWNGRTWVSVSTAPGLSLDALQGVSATGPSDIWSVGTAGAGSLIEHYNGHKWATVPCPCNDAGQLNGVDARTRSDAWAVGFFTPGSSSIAHAEHWNGKRWTQVTTAPVSGSFVELNSVLDLGPANVLAVGDYLTSSGGTSVKHELAEHWNGRAWQRVSVPAFSTDSFLMGISGSASAGVIAVGGVAAGSHNVPLIERWTGTRFVRVAQPVSPGELIAVTVLSRTNAYAVGDTGFGGVTLVEHYNGKRWTRVPSPSPADTPFLASVAAAPSGSFVVAVGSHGLSPNVRILLEQGNGRTWHINRD
jgi:hypothetical protein